MTRSGPAPDGEPRADPRWVLARERTTLARVRLSAAGSVVAVVLASWSPPGVPGAVVTVVGVLAALGALAAAVSVLRRP